jgi:hypothetical protein
LALCMNDGQARCVEKLMLTYLRYLCIPKDDEIPSVELLSAEEGCLAFRSEKELDQGLQRVAARTGRGPRSFEVDIYRFDPETGIYEGRLCGGTAQPFRASINQELSLKPQYGSLKEKFLSGLTVQVDNPVAVGSYLKVEVEEGNDATQVRHARVLWVRRLPDGQHEARLEYQDPQIVANLPRDRFLAVS